MTRFEFLHIALGKKKKYPEDFWGSWCLTKRNRWSPCLHDFISCSQSLLQQKLQNGKLKLQENFLWNSTRSWSRASKKEGQCCILLYYFMCVKMQGLERVRKNSTWEKNLEKLIKNKRLVRKYLASMVSLKKSVILSAKWTKKEKLPKSEVTMMLSFQKKSKSLHESRQWHAFLQGKYQWEEKYR